MLLNKSSSKTNWICCIFEFGFNLSFLPLWTVSCLHFNCFNATDDVKKVFQLNRFGGWKEKERDRVRQTDRQMEREGERDNQTQHQWSNWSKMWWNEVTILFLQNDYFWWSFWRCVWSIEIEFLCICDV